MENKQDFWALFRRAGGLITGLVIVFAIHTGLRLPGMLGPEAWKPLIILSFVFLWFTPFLFLRKSGRIAMGFAWPKLWLFWLPLALALGAGLAVTSYLIGYTFFGHSQLHWFVTVRDTYFGGQDFGDMSMVALFWMFTIPAMIFSPLGEEFFFRGVMDEGLSRLFTPLTGMIVNALLFAGIHLFHHGIGFAASGVYWLGLSAIVWFALMAIFSIVMTVLRRASGSIWTAVIGHAGFNLGMNWTIFTYLMK